MSAALWEIPACGVAGHTVQDMSYDRPSDPRFYSRRGDVRAYSCGACERLDPEGGNVLGLVAS